MKCITILYLLLSDINLFYFIVPIWLGEVVMEADKWLTLEELASYLKLSRSKLYNMVKNNHIPASKVASQWRFDRHEIDEWMKSKR